MKLATIDNGKPDGQLVVVSRDLERVASANGIAATLQDALDRWDEVLQPLRSLYEQLNERKLAAAQRYSDQRLLSPLPRAWQWLDGSAFPQHGKLMAEAFKHPPIQNEFPLMYQGLSHLFYGAMQDVPFASEDDAIDFEGEFGVITGPVPMGTTAAEAARHIRLAVQINDWSLRRYAAAEMKTGFGWILSKPACSLAPVAVTLDELGSCWQDERITAILEVERNGQTFGRVPATEMEIGFDALIAHAARHRPLCAGTLLGSGTVSHSRYRETGSCCISERRAIEMIDGGAATTGFLQFGESITMRAIGASADIPLFGVLTQRVIASKPHSQAPSSK